MTTCTGWFTSSRRPCQRPIGHEGDCGHLVMTWHRYSPPHLLAEYVGRPGYEIDGKALPPSAEDALAESRVTGDPSELVVIGRYEREDGAFFLAFGTPTAYIETMTDFRYDENAKKMRYRCPECATWGGSHLKSCSLR